MKSTQVKGFVAPGFERVSRAFEENFAERREVGASFSAFKGNNLIVDLWAGEANTTSSLVRPWKKNTLAGIFSGTKGLVAVCILLLVERDLIELNAPVARYWPEFAAAGKDTITVADVVSHRSGLPAFKEHVGFDVVLDNCLAAEILAAQSTLLQPGESICYHAFTFGWLCGELVRRIDGRSIGVFFQEEVARPLGLDVWIGLPAEFEDLVAMLALASDWSSKSATRPDDEPGTLGWLVRHNPELITPQSFPWNSRTFHGAQIPGAGAIANSRSIAALYSCLAGDGSFNGVRLLAPETIQIGMHELSRGYEPLLEMPMVFGCGFQLQTELFPFGPPRDAFGHNGAGGSMHGAWPSQGIGYSYVMNFMRNDHKVDPRGAALLAALYASLDN